MRVQVRVQAVLRISRRSVAVADLSASDLARRRQQAPERMSIAAQNNGHNRPLASQSRRRLAARLQVKRAARENEGKAPMVNLVGHHQEVKHPLLAGQPEVGHLPRGPNAAQRSHNTERSNQRKERRRPGHNNSSVIIVAAPKGKFSEPLFLYLQQFRNLHRVEGCAFKQLVA
jgi:hypothetical protein